MCALSPSFLHFVIVPIEKAITEAAGARNRFQEEWRFSAFTHPPMMKQT